MGNGLSKLYFKEKHSAEIPFPQCYDGNPWHRLQYPKIYEYKKEKEGLLFVFLPQTKIGHRGVNLKLQGLAADKTYQLSLEDGEKVKTGAYLMNRGIDIRLEGDYASSILRFKEI